MKNVFLISILTVLISFNISARNITGTVISSEDGLAIPGVSVVLKGNSKIGTTTDMNGRYSIEANDQDILVFSFVGCLTQEVTVGNQTIINIALDSEVLEMDEVVVTGLGGKASGIRIRGHKKMYAECEMSAPASFYYPQEVFNR